MLEPCAICKKEYKPWYNINRNICQDCGKPSKWISVKDRLPEHCQKVLTYGKRNCDEGLMVAYFFDHKQTMETIKERGITNESFDTQERPYYFASQEIKGNILYNPTHWMPLPEAPE